MRIVYRKKENRWKYTKKRREDNEEMIVKTKLGGQRKRIQEKMAMNAVRDNGDRRNERIIEAKHDNRRVERRTKQSCRRKIGRQWKSGRKRHGTEAMKGKLY